MIFTTLLLLGSAAFECYNNFYAKKTLKLGVKTNAYIYTLNIALLTFGLLVFIFFPFNFNFIKLDLILLLLVAAFLRVADLFGMVKGLEDVTPMEMSAISTLTITATYFIDIFIGASTFNTFALLAVLVVVTGSLIISRGSLGIKKAKFALILKVIMSVSRGYIGYFILKQINSATYVFIITLIAVLVMLPFTKKLKPTKMAFKRAYFIQIFGVITFLFQAWLSSISATLYMLVMPLGLGITILATYLMKKETSKLYQLIGAIIVFVGVLGFGFIQFYL